MKKDENLAEFEHDLESEDVEILEVVGVDDDRPAWPDEDDGGEAVDDEDIVLSLDDDEDDPEGAVEIAEDQSQSGPAPSVDPAAAAAGSEQLLRLQADYDNLRKRMERERADFETYATSMLVGRLLPVLDNFERALAIENGEGQDPFREGLLMIYKHLSDELRREGLRPIEAVGCEFDPSLHDAVATDDAAECPPNIVVEELQRGYMFGSRVLRPAMVKVSTNGAEPGEESP